MAIDIIKSKVANPIKNGTTVVTCGATGFPDSPASIVYDRYVKNTPVIEDIESKYDDKYYNGIFVQLAGGQTIIGA